MAKRWASSRIWATSISAAESRAKIVYERLIALTDDPGVKEALGFLMTREELENKMMVLLGGRSVNAVISLGYMAIAARALGVAERLAAAPRDPTLFALFGNGYLAITFDMATSGERYQGIVPLDGDTLFALATKARPALDPFALVALQTEAARCVSRAIAHAMLAVTTVDRTADGGSLLPSYRDALTRP